MLHFHVLVVSTGLTHSRQWFFAIRRAGVAEAPSNVCSGQSTTRLSWYREVKTGSPVNNPSVHTDPYSPYTSYHPRFRSRLISSPAGYLFLLGSRSIPPLYHLKCEPNLRRSLPFLVFSSSRLARATPRRCSTSTIAFPPSGLLAPFGQSGLMCR